MNTKHLSTPSKAIDQYTPAAEGGNPVRDTILPFPYLGRSVMGSEEIELLAQVVKQQTPFRETRNGLPSMVQQFELEARTYFEMPHALATATGSGSFLCAMAALGVGPGDEVLIPSLSWYTDFFAPVQSGATPVFVDIDRSLNMSLDDMLRKITPRTKAIIVVHFQGAAHQIDRIVEEAHKRHISVVEDCAQSAGAKFRGRKLGSWGDLSCFSFQQNKVMTTGDGGLLLAHHPEHFERAARYHDLGGLRPSLAAQLPGKPVYEQFAGCQFRMNEFTGAVALAQLRKLDHRILAGPRRAFRNVKEALTRHCDGIAFRLSTGTGNGEDCGVSLYVDMQTPSKADKLTKYLNAENICTGPPSSCHNMLNNTAIVNKRMAHPQLPPFGEGWPGHDVVYTPASCPDTDEIFASLVCVPFTPQVDEAYEKDVIDAFKKVWSACR